MSEKVYLETVKRILKECRYYQSIESLFEIDLWSFLPPEGGPYRQELSAYVSARKGALLHSPEAVKAARYFQAAGEEAGKDYIEKGLIRNFLALYSTIGQISEETMKAYKMLQAETMDSWKQAREEKDFFRFAPYLDRVFTLKKKMALEMNPDREPFETLVSVTDPGGSLKEVKRQFGVMAEGLRALRGRIEASAIQIQEDILDRPQEPERMAKFARGLCMEMGYKPSRGAFNDRVIHAFSSFVGPKDSRISAYRSGAISLIFTYLHEAGHAIYAGSGNSQVDEAGLWGGLEGGVHESMSRFYENMMGRSRGFWKYVYPRFQKEFLDFAQVPFEDFYRAIHKVKPSARRISSDEVTYNLHILVRFELEREWFAGNLKVKDMRDAWNEKYRFYLGVEPQDDREGILQDMHWAGDYIGYFQSYALGNLYDGQILERMLKDIPDFEQKMEQGEFSTVKEWLAEKIGQYGRSMDEPSLMAQATGSSLDARPFLRYVEKKYGEIYQLV